MALPTGPKAEPLLSVVIPVFNECRTIDRVIAAVRDVDIDTEIIAVDDCSTDGTRDRLRQLAEEDHRLRVFYHDCNRGKGAAVRTGFAAATGRFVVVQDADLEYDPGEFPKLLQPLLEDQADIVFGSRFSNTESPPEPKSWHALGNRFLTSLSNLCTNLNVTDMETCYKVFRREVIQNIPLQENRFGFEPEVTAKIARFRLNGRPLRIQEVGITYRRRSNRDGKKIGWKDGVWAVWCIFRYNWP